MQTVNFYKIVSENTDKVYVGSTKKTIEERLRNHETNYNLFKDGKYHYVSSYDILEQKDFKIQLIETKDCETRKDRNTIECQHIINTPNTTNKYLPGRTRVQYRQDHKEDIKARDRQYYRDNEQNINARHNCNCGGKYTS